MKRRTDIGIVLFILLVLQTQVAFAQLGDFYRELGRNNLRNIERLLQRQANQMDLTWAMYNTISPDIGRSELRGYNIDNMLDVLRLLVRYGADVNKPAVENIMFVNFGYPLELAVRNRRSFSVIQFLLDSGANPNLASLSVYLPLREAWSQNNMAVMNLLLDRGADGSMLLSTLAWNEDNKTIIWLIARGVRIRSDGGASALRNAAEKGNMETIILLVENGVNVNARNEDGKSALSIAYDKGEMEIYNYLLANGAVEFESRPATVQPTAPAASSSTTNVYIQPSAPAQSNPAPVPSTPTLQTGRYAWSNSGTNMTMTLSAGSMVSAFLNNSPIGVWHGTYRINGNQLVITVSNPTSDYANLRGQTYAYTITSSTSFSGSGETWVRTGSF
jgi:ankyrin repeat protein